MEILLGTAVLFVTAVLLALVIERILDLLKSLYDLLDSRYDWCRYWTKLTVKIAGLLENKLKLFEMADPRWIQRLLKMAQEFLLDRKDDHTGGTPTLSADLVRAAAIKLGLKVIGIGVGIALAVCFQIDLIAVWRSAAEVGTEKGSAGVSYFNLVLSGCALGLGTGPVHKIVTGMERRAKKRKQAQGVLS